MPPSRMRFMPLLVAGLLLGACSVSTPPSVTSGPRPAEAIAAVRIEAPSPADPVAGRFADALAAALSRRGVAVAGDSPTILTIAVSQRPAMIGVAAGATGAAGAGDDRLSTARKQRLFDACRAQRLAVRLVARHEARHEPSFAASGGFDYCKLDPADLDRLAERFATAMTTG